MINPSLFLYIGLGAATLYAVIFLVGTYLTRRNTHVIDTPRADGEWKYDEASIRRQDRLLPYSRALTLLAEGEYGFLSMVDGEGAAYGVPVSYAWDGKGAIYIHCAPTGRKIDAIRAHSQVSFCVVENTQVLPAKFTTYYESVILNCIARRGLSDDERRHALELIIEKYSPDFKETGLKYAEKSFGRTEIIRLDILSGSGKSKAPTQ